MQLVRDAPYYQGYVKREEEHCGLQYFPDNVTAYSYF